VVSLPKGVWRFGVVPVNELIAISESCRAFLRQRRQCRIKGTLKKHLQPSDS